MANTEDSVRAMTKRVTTKGSVTSEISRSEADNHQKGPSGSSGSAARDLPDLQQQGVQRHIPYDEDVDETKQRRVL